MTLLSVVQLLFIIFPVYSDSLEDKIINSITKHPTYIEAENNIISSRLEYENLLLAYMPKSINVTGDIFGPIENPDLDYNLGTNFRYQLYTPEKIQKLEEKQFSIDINLKKLEIIKKEILYNICLLLVEIEIKFDEYKLVQEELKSNITYHDKIKERFQSRDISKSELDYSYSIVLNSRAGLIDAENLLNRELSNFYKETNILLDNLGHIKINYYSLLGSTSITLLNTQLNDLKTKQLSSGLIDDNRIFIPSIALSASIKFPFNTGSSWAIGVDFNLPIFSRESIAEENNLTYLKLDSIERNSARIVDDRDYNLNSININMESISKKIDLYKESLVLSESSLENIIIESKYGVRTVFDVINAQNNVHYIKRRINYSNGDLLKEQLKKIYLTGIANEI